MNTVDYIQKSLQTAQLTGNYRSLPAVEQQGKWVLENGRKMLNVSSNDYLGIAADEALKNEFFSRIDAKSVRLSASSSRLLSGNFVEHEKLEHLLAQMFGTESALVFNSGYHANIGILPAVSDKDTVILADKFVHASLIDGIRLSSAVSVRYRHNDYRQLESLVEKYSARASRIIIVTESIFSMDGDSSDLPRLVSLKRKYENVLLYVDEAHAVGVRGEKGLGCAEACGCVQEIDFLVGTFGKALASMGAYIVCKNHIREFLVNNMRPLIFSTALPPLLCEWTSFVLTKLPGFAAKRQHLSALSSRLKTAVLAAGYPCVSDSHIIPVVIGDSRQAVAKSTEWQQRGFYVLPVRPPSVPEGTARIRLSLSADINDDEAHELINLLR